MSQITPELEKIRDARARQHAIEDNGSPPDFETQCHYVVGFNAALIPEIMAKTPLVQKLARHIKHLNHMNSELVKSNYALKATAVRAHVKEQQ